MVGKALRAKLSVFVARVKEAARTRKFWVVTALTPWALALVVALLYGLVYGIITGWGWMRTATLIPAIVRDTVFALYADSMVGDPVVPSSIYYSDIGEYGATIVTFDYVDKNGNPYTFEVDFLDSALYESDSTWDSLTNSKWLARQARLIVPLLSYEKLVQEANYPGLVAFLPYSGSRSLHVGGSADLSWIYGFVVMINERYLLPPDTDLVEVYAILVHELIHIQGGLFLRGSSESLEAYTSAATLEVLAALCNEGQPLACEAFWLDMKTFARRSLDYNTSVLGIGWYYDWFSNTFMRDDVQVGQARHRDRYWQEHREEEMDIIRKYGYLPWIQKVIPGFTGGRQWELKTGNTVSEFGGRTFALSMPWDDTKDVLGWFWPQFFNLFGVEH